MRKVLLAVAVLALLITGVSVATAQEQITLDGAGTNTMNFTGTGSGNWSLTFATNPFTGPATGVNGWSGITGYYFINMAGVSINGTLTSYMPFPGGSFGAWNVTQSAPLSFSICPTSAACSSATALLTGTLELVNLQQTVSTSGTFSTAVFNYGVIGNLTITGGSDASLVTPTVEASLTIDLPETNLATLASGATLKGSISSGEILPTPEPVSMALVGSGLVLLGAFVRRRRSAH